VSGSRILKLLVVEDNLEDEQLLCEALIEIEENRQWCNWRAATIVQVDQLTDALDCLRREHFDAVLLNLSLPDSPALLDTFLEVNACAGETPIVVLADEPDENLANRLLRNGAQDVFLKSELECGPLARSVRYAIERQRRMAVAERRAPSASEETSDLPEGTAEERELRELLVLQAGEVFDIQNHAPFTEEQHPAKTAMLLD